MKANQPTHIRNRWWCLLHTEKWHFFRVLYLRSHTNLSRIKSNTKCISLYKVDESVWEASVTEGWKPFLPFSDELNSHGVNVYVRTAVGSIIACCTKKVIPIIIHHPHSMSSLTRRRLLILFLICVFFNMFSSNRCNGIAVQQFISTTT